MLKTQTLFNRPYFNAEGSIQFQMRNIDFKKGSITARKGLPDPHFSINHDFQGQIGGAVEQRSDDDSF